ncbi:MAG: hypothetical protein WDZ51_12725 [Pirellulaceae bacterium]
MQENDSENPFQSPVSSEPKLNKPPFPTGLFWGASGGLLLVCLVLFFTFRGLGMIGLLVLVPAMLRGFLMIQRERKKSRGTWGPTQLIFISFLLMIPIFLAASLGFGITCFSAAIILDNLPRRFGRGDLPTFLLGVFGPALGVGVFIFALLFWLSLTYRGKTPKPSDATKEP